MEIVCAVLRASKSEPSLWFPRWIQRIKVDLKSRKSISSGATVFFCVVISTGRFFWISCRVAANRLGIVQTRKGGINWSFLKFIKVSDEYLYVDAQNLDRGLWIPSLFNPAYPGPPSSPYRPLFKFYWVSNTNSFSCTAARSSVVNTFQHSLYNVVYLPLFHLSAMAVAMPSNLYHFRLYAISVVNSSSKFTTSLEGNKCAERFVFSMYIPARHHSSNLLYEVCVVGDLLSRSRKLHNCLIQKCFIDLDLFCSIYVLS